MDPDVYPTRVLLMAEHTVQVPLCDRSPTPDMTCGPFGPGELGLPPECAGVNLLRRAAPFARSLALSSRGVDPPCARDARAGS